MLFYHQPFPASNPLLSHIVSQNRHHWIPQTKRSHYPEGLNIHLPRPPLIPTTPLKGPHIHQPPPPLARHQHPTPTNTLAHFTEQSKYPIPSYHNHPPKTSDKKKKKKFFHPFPLPGQLASATGEIHPYLKFQLERAKKNFSPFGPHLRYGHFTRSELSAN